MSLRLLVLGASGQVGSALSALHSPALQIDPVRRSQADLLNPDLCVRIINSTTADAVINAAAFTDVDSAERMPDIAMQVNAIAPGKMAKAAAQRGLPFLHISTDYVFDGAGTTPWAEDDLANPLNAYGVSKYQGELEVLGAGGPSAVLRTSWVHDGTGKNFVQAMRRAATSGKPLRIIDDQWGGPTSAKAIANALVIMARAFVADNGRNGVYHFQGEPWVTWYGFAKAIFARSGLPETPSITPISSAEWPTPATRPLNGRLNCSRILRTFGIRQPNWRQDLTEMLLTEVEPAT
ncbi:MAG: dTDP-4-dehydrorhamnose reductase [Pseudomonadota bacterium]